MVSYIWEYLCKIRLTCDEDEGVSEAVVDEALVAGEARLGGRQQDLERDVELDGVRQEDRSGEQQDVGHLISQLLDNLVEGVIQQTAKHLEPEALLLVPDPSDAGGDDDADEARSLRK